MSDQASKKVVHLSTVHRATDTRIFVKECRSLAKAGYDVTLIARASRNETIDGVNIMALKGRSGNRLWRMTATAIDVYRRARKADGDVYHFHDPELMPIGLLLKLRGKRVVYDVHETVSKQIRSKFWIPGILRIPVATAYRLVERFASSMFDGIVAATPGIAEQFSPGKTVVVQNFAIVEEFASIDESDYESRSPDLVYIGGVTRVRGISEMVDALDLLKSEAKLILGGAFQPPQLEAEMKAKPGYRKVDFRGWLSRDGVREALASARVGLLVLHPEPNYLNSYPVKLFEYNAAGLPVVASDFPLWKNLVSELGCGLVVEPKNPQAIADAVQWLLDHPEEAKSMGERGRQVVLEKYNWDAEFCNLLALYESLFGPPQVQRV